MAPLNFLGTIYRVIQESFINMENMFTLLEEQIEVEDQPGARQYLPDPTLRPPDIEFRSVAFHYVEEKGVLEDISFRIPSGTSVGVVGATGCGKSTIAKLMFRLFDPVEGMVLLNDEDIRDYTQHSFRQPTTSFSSMFMVFVMFEKQLHLMNIYGQFSVLKNYGNN